MKAQNQNEILKINADELRVIAKQQRSKVSLKERLELLKLILFSIQKKAEEGGNEIDLLPVLNKFLKIQEKESNDFFLSNDDFKHIFEELEERNFIIKISQYETDQIDIFVSWK